MWTKIKAPVQSIFSSIVDKWQYRSSSFARTDRDQRWRSNVLIEFLRNFQSSKTYICHCRSERAAFDSQPESWIRLRNPRRRLNRFQRLPVFVDDCEDSKRWRRSSAAIRLCLVCRRVFSDIRPFQRSKHKLNHRRWWTNIFCCQNVQQNKNQFDWRTRQSLVLLWIGRQQWRTVDQRSNAELKDSNFPHCFISQHWIVYEMILNNKKIYRSSMCSSLAWKRTIDIGWNSCSSNKALWQSQLVDLRQRMKFNHRSNASLVLTRMWSDFS